MKRTLDIPSMAVLALMILAFTNGFAGKPPKMAIEESHFNGKEASLIPWGYA